MTTQEVDELIKQEIYENNVGHITGTVLSAVLQEINNKRLTSYDIFGSTYSEKQEIISAFAGVFDTATIGRGYLDAQSALLSALVRRLTHDIMYNFSSPNDVGATHELVTAIMNRIGYEYQAFNPVYNMFQSAIASAVAAELSEFSNDDAGAIRIVSAIMQRITKDQFGIEAGLGITDYNDISNFPAIFLASACMNLEDGGFRRYTKSADNYEDVFKYINYHNLTSSIMNDMGYQYYGENEPTNPGGWNMFRSAILSALIDRKTRDGDDNGYRFLANNLQSSLIGDQLFVSGIFLSMLHNHDVSYEYRNLMCDFALGIFNSAINYNRLDDTTLRNLASAIKSYLY